MTQTTKPHSLRTPTPRSGVAAMEFVFVFSVFFVIVLGFLDLGVMLLRRNLLADAAQRVSREAAVHGGRSEPADQRWGPGALSTSGSDTRINSVITPSLTTMAASEILVDVQWSDGNNNPGSRVQVTLSYQHQAILPYLWSEDLLALQGSCVARVAH
jgi:Flp pilus assembly protein TadG